MSYSPAVAARAKTALDAQIAMVRARRKVDSVKVQLERAMAEHADANNAMHKAELALAQAVVQADEA